MRLRPADLLADPLNRQVLDLLRADPRLGVAELARRVGMSAPAVRERLLRLEEAGIIAGWRLDLDHRALGHPVTAFVRLRPLPGALPKVAALAERTPEIVECHRITGEDCFILKLHVPTIEALDTVLDPMLALGQTTTSIVVATPVPPRALPLPGEPRPPRSRTARTPVVRKVG